MMRQHSTGVPQGPLIWIMTDDNHFDVLVIGTGVTESVLSAALSRAGKRVLHIDTNAYYGAEWTSLTLSELSQWRPSLTQTLPSHASQLRLAVYQALAKRWIVTILLVYAQRFCRRAVP